ASVRSEPGSNAHVHPSTQRLTQKNIPHASSTQKKYTQHATSISLPKPNLSKNYQQKITLH
ncbi:MAG: hypothetical protein J6P00_02295, partial [Acetobacter sp.]|nr:hypothetical protein [Acetobacter sp.]